MPPKEVKEKEVVKVPINLKKVEDRPRESIAPVVTEPRRDSLKFIANEELAEIDKVNQLWNISTFKLTTVINDCVKV